MYPNLDLNRYRSRYEPAWLHPMVQIRPKLAGSFELEEPLQLSYSIPAFSKLAGKAGHRARESKTLVLDFHPPTIPTINIDT